MARSRTPASVGVGSDRSVSFAAMTKLTLVVRSLVSMRTGAVIAMDRDDRFEKGPPPTRFRPPKMKPAHARKPLPVAARMLWSRNVASTTV